MTMHLVRGMSTTQTKKRKAKKLNMEKLEVEWRQYNKQMRRNNMHSCQFDTLQDYANYIQGKVRRTKPEFKPYVPEVVPYRRETQHIKSLTTSDKIPTHAARREKMEYTGDYIVGIATMHKSNLVPVGKGSDPKDYATMRRN